MTMRITEEVKVDQVEIKNAIDSGDSDKFAEAIVKNIQANGDRIQQELIEEAKAFNIENADASILAQRGFKPLTAAET